MQRSLSGEQIDCGHWHDLNGLQAGKSSITWTRQSVHLQSLSKLQGFVHHRQFKHVIYAKPTYMLVGTLPSSNLRSRKSIVTSLKIEEDPWAINCCAMLRCLELGPNCTRIACHGQLTSMTRSCTWARMTLSTLQRRYVQTLARGQLTGTSSRYVSGQSTQATSFPSSPSR